MQRLTWNDFTVNIKAIEYEGRHLYSAWDSSLFVQLMIGPAQLLFRSIAESVSSRKVVDTYLRLIQEGVGLGLLTTPVGSIDTLAHTLLSYCLLTLIPDQLSLFPEEARLGILCDTWNLCENISALPRWAEVYLCNQASMNLLNISRLESFLESHISILFNPNPKWDWTGELITAIIDTKVLDYRFLPGGLHLLTPNVVAIQDRFRDSFLALVIAPKGDSVVLGPFGDRFEPFTEKDPPLVVVQSEGAIVEGRHIQLASINQLDSCVASSAGFLVGSAVDSQRLWLVRRGG